MNKTTTEPSSKIIDPSQLPKDSALALATRLTSRYFYVAYSKLMSLRWEWTNITPFGATDGERLLLNPKGIAKLEEHEKGVNLIAFLLVHEALHALLGHSWRLAKLSDHQKANIAADYVINMLIKQQNQKLGKDIFLLIDGCLIDDKLDPSWSAEKLYRQLNSKPPEPEPEPEPQDGDDSDEDDSGDLNDDSDTDSGDDDSSDGDDTADGDDDASSSSGDNTDDSEDGDGSSSGGDTDDGDGDDEGAGGAGAPTDANGDVDFSKFPGTGAPDLVEPDLDGRSEDEFVEQQEEINERVMIGDQIDRQQQGDSGGVGKRLSQQRQEFSGINWFERLAEWLMKRSKNGWNSPLNVSEFTVTGLVAAGRRGKRCGDMVFVFDTSGSIGQETYERFLAAARQCMEELEPENMHLLSVSHLVCDSYSLQAGDVVPESMKGGGGTAFKPAFDWVERNVDNPDVLVYLTDGWATDRTTLTPVDYPVLWLSTSVDASGFPFGEVMEIINA